MCDKSETARGTANNRRTGEKRDRRLSSSRSRGLAQTYRYTWTRYDPRSALTPVMSIFNPEPAVFTELYGIAGL